MSTRADRVTEAQRLRVQGIPVREIAARMDAKPKTVYAWLADPDLSKQRRTREAYRGACEVCGAPTAPDRPDSRVRFCLKHGAEASGNAAVERGLRHRAQIEDMWARGLTIREICAEMGRGYTKSLISNLRKRGYDLPHRRTPDQVRAIVEGRAKSSGPSLTELAAMGRAARAAKRQAAA